MISTTALVLMVAFFLLGGILGWAFNEYAWLRRTEIIEYERELDYEEDEDDIPGLFETFETGPEDDPGPEDWEEEYSREVPYADDLPTDQWFWDETARGLDGKPGRWVLTNPENETTLTRRLADAPLSAIGEIMGAPPLTWRRQAQPRKLTRAQRKQLTPSGR